MFMLGCIPARLLLTNTARTAEEGGMVLTILGLVTLVMGLGFIVIHLGGLRDTGNEVFGGKIWWDKWRVLHGMMYCYFASFALGGDNSGWKILLADTMIGLLLFLNHHFLDKNKLN